MSARARMNTGVGSGLIDRAGQCPAPSASAARRRRRLNPSMLKPVTYAVMHFAVAVGVAYGLTRDWRIALGVGIIEPLVQTVAYIMHEKAWSWRGRRRNR